MVQLGDGKTHKITLGSVRGGGAVAAYRAGADLTGLLSSMRLKSLQTLAYYLQEVAADTALTKLDQATIQNIRSMQAFFKALLLHVVV